MVVYKKICGTCGKIEYRKAPIRGVNCSSCAIRKHRTGTGRKDKGNSGGGYRMIYVNGVRIYEHRHVMEKHLGRRLGKDEHIHHKDHNRINNVISNLELTSARDHAFEHKHMFFNSETSARAYFFKCLKRSKEAMLKYDL